MVFASLRAGFKAPHTGEDREDGGEFRKEALMPNQNVTVPSSLRPRTCAKLGADLAVETMKWLCVASVALAGSTAVEAFNVLPQRRGGGRAARTGATTAGQHTHAVPSLDRIDVTGLSPSQVSDEVDFSRPCILTGVLPTPDCEAWCNALLQDLGGETCAFQIRDNQSGRSEMFEASLVDFVQGLQEESTHDESW